MAHYKDRCYPIGSSDFIASLTVRFPMSAEVLKMGANGSYMGYVVFNDEANIPDHYQKVLSGREWCRIYDDYDLVMVVHGETIDIYRAGDAGILIHATGSAWVDPVMA